MDYDAFALASVVVSLVALLLTANILWFMILIMSSTYGGWRLGQRLIPPEPSGV